MSKISLEPQLLRSKKPRPLTKEELHPLTRRNSEIALKKASRETLPPEEGPRKREAD